MHYVLCDKYDKSTVSRLYKVYNKLCNKMLVLKQTMYC